nr:TolC family protein [uncultured Desulfobacter sp.]
MCIVPVRASETKPAPLINVNARQLVHWIVATNADVGDKRYSLEASIHRFEAETGLYEPVLTAGANLEENHRQRSSSEYSKLIAGAQTEENEKKASLETGLKFPLPTGGEASVSYSYTDLESNLFAEDTDVEYTGRLELTFKQPLLKGFGKKVTETGKRVAALEEDAARVQLRIQLLQAAGDGAQLYWELYRAYEILSIRRSALDNANKLRADLQLRVERGRAAQAELLEAEAAIAEREAQLARAKQMLSEVMSNILIQQNSGDGINNKHVFKPVQAPDFAHRENQGPGERIQYATTHYPEYKLLEIQRQIADERYGYSRNMTLPKLDLILGCSFDQLDTETDKAIEKSFSDDYFDWKAGLFLEIPLGGNIQASSRAKANKVQLEQAVHRIKALHNRIGNTIEGRWEQLQKAYEEVRNVESSVGLQSKLLAIDRKLFERGRLRLRDVIEREIQLNEAKQRFVETASRVEIARIRLMMSDGRLLETYEIDLKD